MQNGILHRDTLVKTRVDVLLFAHGPHLRSSTAHGINTPRPNIINRFAPDDIVLPGVFHLRSCLYLPPKVHFSEISFEI